MPRDFHLERVMPTDPRFPSRLETLGPRQREIAEIVYATASATPREVQARLSERRSVRVVRTLLDRMVAKGVLKRRRSGRHSEVIYVAAIVTQAVREAALRRLLNERFGGSITDATAVIASMAKRAPRIPRTLAAARQLANDLGRSAPASKGATLTH